MPTTYKDKMSSGYTSRPLVAGKVANRIKLCRAIYIYIYIKIAGSVIELEGKEKEVLTMH